MADGKREFLVMRYQIFDIGSPIFGNREMPAECSKRPFSKAAASEGPEAYPLGYVEGLNDATCLREAASAEAGNEAGGLFQHSAKRAVR